MSMLKTFRESRESISLVLLADKLGVNIEDLYPPELLASNAYLYCDCIYILELKDGRFYSMLDRSEYFGTLAEVEQAIYIGADYFCAWFNEVNTEVALIDEMVEFCEVWELEHHSADELYYEMLNEDHKYYNNHWVKQYLKDFIKRWENNV